MAIKKEREFAPADRYVYDFGLCNYKRGWAQLDTKQDASYYGTWASPTKRLLFNYCEGDTTLTTCDSDEEFAAEIREWAEWVNGAGHGPAKIDGMCSGPIIQAFKRLGLGDLLH